MAKEQDAVAARGAAGGRQPHQQLLQARPLALSPAGAGGIQASTQPSAAQRQPAWTWASVASAASAFAGIGAGTVNAERKFSYHGSSLS